MLTKIFSRQLKINSLLKKSQSLLWFGSAGSAHHDHHDYSVTIDKNTTWIKYNTNRRLACVDGIIDTNYKMKDPDDSDPYTHLK